MIQTCTATIVRTRDVGAGPFEQPYVCGHPVMEWEGELVHVGPCAQRMQIDWDLAVPMWVPKNAGSGVCGCAPDHWQHNDTDGNVCYHAFLPSTVTLSHQPEVSS